MKAEFQRKMLPLAIAAAGLIGAADVRAAEKVLALEEVIVTATKQEETVSNVGASIVAVGNKQIDEMGFRSMSALVASMPNVSVQEAPTGTKLTIRGVGTIPTGGASSAVATFVDGVYQGNTSLTNNILVDMERVEILRGPQGTLFGKNSISGVMNLITARPTQDFEGLIDLRGGNRDSHEGTAVISGGLTDNLSARFMAYKQHTGDYLDNTAGPGGAGGTDKESYRLSVNWDISSDTSIWFKYQHDHNKVNAATNQLIAIDPDDADMIAELDPGLLARTDTKLDGHYAASSLTQYGYDAGLNPHTVTNSDRDLFATTLNHVFDNEFELTATLGYDRNRVLRRGTISQDFPLLTIYLDNQNLYETKNFEIRVASPTDDRFRYTLGAYAEEGKFGIDDGNAYINFDFLAPTLNAVMQLPPPPALPPNGPGIPSFLLLSEQALTPSLIVNLGTPYGWNTTTSFAVYGQFTFDFTDELSLTVGARYADDKINQEKKFGKRTDLNGNPLFSNASFAASGPIAPAYAALAKAILGNAVGIGYPGLADFDETHHDRAFLPAAKLEFRPDPDSLYYFSAQTGYKNGGYSTDGLGYPEEFDKETSLAFELGSKWKLADGRGQLGAAIFRTDFKDLQVATIDPASGGVLFKNAAKAYTQGIELETRWQLIESLAVGLQYAYLEARYRSFPSAPGNVSQQIDDPGFEQDLGGKSLPHAPRNSASASADFRQPLVGSLEFLAGLQVAYTDDMYTDLPASDQLKAHSSVLVNARVALTDVDALWTVALIGNNVTNDRHQMYGTTSSIIGKGTYFGSIRPPASYWLQLEKRF